MRAGLKMHFRQQHLMQIHRKRTVNSPPLYKINTDNWNMYVDYRPNAIIGTTYNSTSIAVTLYMMQGHNKDH